MANKVKGKRRMKRTIKVLRKNREDNDRYRLRIKLEKDWNRLCAKLGWFD